MDIEINKYKILCESIDDLLNKQDSQEYKKCLQNLEQYAENGSLAAAEFLAELLTIDGENYDAEKAYKWYFIALSFQGYKTEFKDLNNSPPHYCGAVGDFRNESLVADLVSELGFEKVQEIDELAKEWMTKNVMF